MELKSTIDKMVQDNLRLITTDRDLQKFMVGAFSLLLLIILYCTFFGDFQQAEEYFSMADRMLSGTISYDELETDLPPLTLLLLIPPRLFSPNAEVYCYLFSLYGFAFYMLGGHFMLKSCRETGSPQRSAYICLFITFLCSFYFMTLCTGSFAPAFVIISLWFYHLGRYTISLTSLALATMTGLYPAILFIAVFFHLLRSRRLSEAKYGVLAYLAICAALTGFSLVGPGSDFRVPFFTVPEAFSEHALLEPFIDWIGITDPESFWASAITLSIVVGFVYAVQLKRDSTGMKPMATVAALGLLAYTIVSPDYFPGLYIGVAMLIPMTQMCNCRFMEKKRIWIAFILFSVTSAACDLILPTDCTVYCIAAFLRIASALVLLMCLGEDCNRFLEEASKKRA